MVNGWQVDVGGILRCRRVYRAYGSVLCSSSGSRLTTEHKEAPQGGRCTSSRSLSAFTNTATLSNHTALMKWCTNFWITKSHFKILDARRVTWSKFHTANPQILGATVKKMCTPVVMSHSKRKPKQSRKWSLQRNANSYTRRPVQNYSGLYNAAVISEVPPWTKGLETLSWAQTYVRDQLHIPAALPPGEVAVPECEAVWAKNGCAR